MATFPSPYSYLRSLSGGSDDTQRVQTVTGSQTVVVARSANFASAFTVST